MSEENNTVTLDIEQVKAFLATEQGASLIEDTDAVKSLRGKRDELLGEKDKWKQKWASYEALGDVETLRKALEQANKETKTPENTVDPDLVESLKTQIAERDNALELFKTNFVKSQVDSRIDSAIVEAKGNPRLLKHIVQERVKASLNDNGEVVVEVYTKDGKKMFRHDSSPATIADLVADLRNDEDLGIAFASSGANGAGTRSTTTKAGGVILDRSHPDFDATKAMQYYQKHGFKP